MCLRLKYPNIKRVRKVCACYRFLLVVLSPEQENDLVSHTLFPLSHIFPFSYILLIPCEHSHPRFSSLYCYRLVYRYKQSPCMESMLLCAVALTMFCSLTLSLFLSLADMAFVQHSTLHNTPTQLSLNTTLPHLEFCSFVIFLVLPSVFSACEMFDVVCAYVISPLVGFSDQRFMICCCAALCVCVCVCLHMCMCGKVRERADVIYVPVIVGGAFMVVTSLLQASQNDQHCKSQRLYVLKR